SACIRGKRAAARRVVVGDIGRRRTAVRRGSDQIELSGLKYRRGRPCGHRADIVRTVRRAIHDAVAVQIDGRTARIVDLDEFVVRVRRSAGLELADHKMRRRIHDPLSIRFYTVAKAPDSERGNRRDRKQYKKLLHYFETLSAASHQAARTENISNQLPF